MGHAAWEALAEQLGAVEDTAHGRAERGSDDLARAAIEKILGEDEFRAAVDHYVARGRGSELARSVLWLVRPDSAMQRCREISTESTDPEARRAAVELLRVVADRRALPWVSGYLDDPDEGVQQWGIGIVDQLLFSDLIEPEDAEPLLRRAEEHPNAEVRAQAEGIRAFLKSRA